MGTVAYMLLEQAQGAEVNHVRTSGPLRVVLYEMITGRQAFEGAYEQAVMYSITHEDAAAVTGLRTGVPIELARVLNKALVKKPDESYQHVGEMLVDLKSLGKEFETEAKKRTPGIYEENLIKYGEVFF